MNPLESYSQKVANTIGAQLLELPAPYRGQFLFEVLENISPGLYARTLLNANAMTGQGKLSQGEAVHLAIADGFQEAFARQLVSMGTPPMALGSFLDDIGDFAVDVVTAPFKLAGKVSVNLVSVLAKTTAGILTKATCPIISTGAGKVAAVGAAAYFSGGSAVPAATVGVGALSAGCQAGSAAPAAAAAVAPRPVAPPPSVLSKLSRYAIPGAVVLGGIAVLALVLKHGKKS